MKAKENINPDNLLTVAQYAKRIGKTTQRVYQLIDKKEVETLMIGKRVFVINTK